MTLYVDVLFAINFSMDFLTLFICSIILHKKIYRTRILISSAIGGIYSLVDMLINMPFAIKVIICVGISILMCIIAFKDRSFKGFLAFFVMYWGVGTALGGIMSLLYSFLNRILAEYIADYSYENAYNGARFLVIASISAIISIIFSKFFSQKKVVSTVNVLISFKESCFKFTGLCDSGNVLTEPISGNPVILISEDSHLGKEISNIQEIHKRYIPYKDVSGSGILLGVKPEKVIINSICVDAIVAPAKKKDFCGCDALVPLSLV